MADHSITAADVQPTAGQTWTLANGTAGGTITAGQPVYADATDGGDLKPCINTAEATANCVGIAVGSAADKQPIRYLTAGRLTVTGTLTTGRVYYVSGNAGGICLEADIVSGDWVCALGIAVAGDQIEVDIQVGGVAIA